MSYASVFIPLLLAALLSLLIKQATKKRGFPLPPGPKGLPFVGNALQMPREREYRTFTEWGKQYGKLPVITCD